MVVNSNRMSSSPPRRSRITAAFQDFAQRGVLSGILLMIATAVALAWANSPWADSYVHLWEIELSVGPAARPITASLHPWINDGLMAVFFSARVRTGRDQA